MLKSALSFLKCVDCNNTSLLCKDFEMDSKGNVKAGMLLCNKCDSCFPIYDGIPIIISNTVIKLFLSDAIVKFCSKNKICFNGSYTYDKDTEIVRNGASNWGFQWGNSNENFNDTNVYYLSENFFLNTIHINKEEYKDKNVLVLGTGFGKEIAHLSQYLCKNIFAMDISFSIYIAKQRYVSFPHVHFVMADIMKPPFIAQFDIVIADHVLQHLPAMQKGTDEALALVRNDGIFAATYYSYENNFIMHAIVEPFKKIYSRLVPIKILFYLSIIPAAACFFLVKVYKLLNKINPRFLIRLPLSDHFLCWSKLPFVWLWKITIFDLLQAPLSKYCTKKDIETMFLKYRNLQIKSHVGTLWCVRVIKD
ncbi:MAG: methyltransferase domain-containing protein [Candidatus Omnitrophica bacterium]|nr:methyltransferase domain-containing protein [Candidatus Omnitrophota bacterium]